MQKIVFLNHEPFFDMSRKPIYWYQEGRLDKIRKKFALKKFLINGHKTKCYIETNHLFLKSFADVAIESFKDMKLVHLIRSPLEVAKSQYYRKEWIGDPGRTYPRNYAWAYRGDDGKWYCRHALTGKEQIFKDISIPLNRYKQLLVQWIEIENRAMRFLEKYNKYDDCFNLYVPEDFYDLKKIEKLFDFIDIETIENHVILQGEKNRASRPTVVTKEDTKELQDLVENIPNSYLEIFKYEPYCSKDWAKILIKDEIE